MIKLHCKIFGKVLRDHREKKGLSQEDVEAMIGYTRSHISKIENGKRTIKRESADAIIKLLNIDFATDKETIDHYDELFSNLYIAILSFDDENIDKYHDLIDNEKKNISKSLSMYRYPLFEFVHDLYKHKNCDIEELLDFEKSCSSLLSLDDRQILYNSIGYCYRLKGKIDIAYSWYKKGLQIEKRSLGYAMNAYRIGWIISNRNDNLAAYALVNNALEIFKNHKISEKVKNCKNVLAYISSHAGEFETAISFYLDLIKNYSITDHNSTHQLRGGLLWCYIKNGDYQSVRNTINKIYNEDTNEYDLNLICVIIYFSYLTNDINLFDKWYAYSKQCHEDDEVNRSLIELYKYYFYDEGLDVIEKRAEKTLKLLRNIEDRDEYLMIKELLCKLYAKHNSPKYYDILEELYALERHTLGYYIPNSTTATLK